MKAFEIVWDKMPDCRGVYFAPSAGKAKYSAALIIIDCGYAQSLGDVFKGLRCKRRPDLDMSASQFDSVTGRSADYFEN